jgi:hypothetical protein
MKPTREATVNANQLAELRWLVGSETPKSAAAAKALHRRGLVYVVDQCGAGCCRRYRLTEFGRHFYRFTKEISAPLLLTLSTLT